MSTALLAQYRTDGYVSGVPILSAAAALEHRRALEDAEEKLGALHYLNKVHTVVSSAWNLATHPNVLDAVEAFIGPNILLYNATYIIKEPGSNAHVAWHQDLTYWGLSDDDGQVSMWLALSPATEQSGCMKMIPGSHVDGARVHHTRDDDPDGVDDGELLLLGQHINEVDASNARLAALAPGEASFHHGWTVHTSHSNQSADRRIGLNVQFVAAHNGIRADARGASTAGSAALVRGVDKHRHFAVDRPPSANLDPAAVAAWRDLAAAMDAGFTTDAPS